MKKILLYWGPPIIWMIAIFLLSSRQRIEVSEKYIWNFLFFKLLHIIEYATLNLLLFRGFNSLKNKFFAFPDKLFFSFLIAILYAVSDEIHQTFVPTREGKIRDVFIDFIGIYLMHIYIKRNLNFIKKFI